RLRTGHGLKGDRHYDWALLDVPADDTPTGHAAGHSHLVIRRHRYTGELSFYRCHSATPVALATLVDVICCRWKIEEDLQLGKSACGLDQGQTTCWNSWMRWTLISLLAAAVLTVTRLRTTAQATPGRLVPVSARELLRLLRATVLPPPRRDRDHLLHWSAWRRQPAPGDRSTPSLEQRHRRRDNMTRPA
ncbi:IS701 family transposase, partial [Streptomyces murinus]